MSAKAESLGLILFGGATTIATLYSLYTLYQTAKQERRLDIESQNHFRSLQRVEGKRRTGVFPHDHRKCVEAMENYGERSLLIQVSDLVLFTISSFLEPKDLVNFSRVCRMFSCMRLHLILHNSVWRNALSEYWRNSMPCGAAFSSNSNIRGLIVHLKEDRVLGRLEDKQDFNDAYENLMSVSLHCVKPSSFRRALTSAVDSSIDYQLNDRVNRFPLRLAAYFASDVFCQLVFPHSDVHIGCRGLPKKQQERILNNTSLTDKSLRYVAKTTSVVIDPLYPVQTKFPTNMLTRLILSPTGDISIAVNYFEVSLIDIEAAMQPSRNSIGFYSKYSLTEERFEYSLKVDLEGRLTPSNFQLVDQVQGINRGWFGGGLQINSGDTLGVGLMRVVVSNRLDRRDERFYFFCVRNGDITDMSAGELNWNINMDYLYPTAYLRDEDMTVAFNFGLEPFMLTTDKMLDLARGLIDPEESDSDSEEDGAATDDEEWEVWPED